MSTLSLLSSAIPWFWQAVLILSIILFNAAMVFLIVISWRNLRKESATRPRSAPAAAPAAHTPPPLEVPPAPSAPLANKPSSESVSEAVHAVSSPAAEPPSPPPPSSVFAELDRLKAEAEDSLPPLSPAPSAFPMAAEPPSIQSPPQKSLAEVLGTVETRPAPSSSTEVTLLDALAEAVLSVDRHGIILSCNRTTERLFGYTRAELCGRPMDHFISVEGDGDLGTQHPVAHDDETLAMEHEALGVCKDGTRFPALVTVSLAQADPILLAVSIRNIQSRKSRHQEALGAPSASAPLALAAPLMEKLLLPAQAIERLAASLGDPHSPMQVAPTLFSALQDAAQQFRTTFLEWSQSTAPATQTADNPESAPSSLPFVPLDTMGSSSSGELPETAVVCDPGTVFQQAIAPTIAASSRMGVEWHLDGLTSHSSLCFLPEQALARIATHLAKWAACQQDLRGVVVSLERMERPAEEPSFASPVSTASLSSTTVEGLYFRIAAITTHPPGQEGEPDLMAAMKLTEKAAATLAPLPPFEMGRGYELSCFARSLALPPPSTPDAENTLPQEFSPSTSSTPAYSLEPAPLVSLASSQKKPLPEKNPPSKAIKKSVQKSPARTKQQSAPTEKKTVATETSVQAKKTLPATQKTPSATPAQPTRPSNPPRGVEKTPPPASRADRKPATASKKVPPSPAAPAAPVLPPPPTLVPATAKKRAPSIDPPPSISPSKSSRSKPASPPPQASASAPPPASIPLPPPPVLPPAAPPSTPPSNPAEVLATTIPASSAPPLSEASKKNRTTSKKSVLPSMPPPLRAVMVVEDPAERIAVDARLAELGVKDRAALSPIELLDALRHGKKWDFLILQLDHSDAADFDLSYEVRQYLPEEEMPILSLPARTETARQILPLFSLQGEFAPEADRASLHKILQHLKLNKVNAFTVAH